MSFKGSIKSVPRIHIRLVWAQVVDPLKTPNAPLSLLKVPSRCADHRRKKREKKKAEGPCRDLSEPTYVH